MYTLNINIRNILFMKTIIRYLLLEYCINSSVLLYENEKQFSKIAMKVIMYITI